MMVHSLSRRQKVQCNQCGGFFYVHTVRSRVFFVLLFLLMVLILAEGIVVLIGE
jgi:hypothetical protein